MPHLRIRRTTTTQFKARYVIALLFQGIPHYTNGYYIIIQFRQGMLLSYCFKAFHITLMVIILLLSSGKVCYRATVSRHSTLYY